MRSKWIKELNGGRECPAVGWTSKETKGKRNAFQLDCLIYVGWLQLDTLRKNGTAPLQCLFCQNSCAGSLYWRRAVKVLEQVDGLGDMAFESHLLVPCPGRAKPFDIFLVLHKMAIEVDGSYHFCGSWKGIPWQVQYDWDRKVDKACQQQGQRLVRLHYKDESEWASTVKAALDSQQIVTYTKSYGL